MSNQNPALVLGLEYAVRSDLERARATLREALFDVERMLDGNGEFVVTIARAILPNTQESAESALGFIQRVAASLEVEEKA